MLRRKALRRKTSLKAKTANHRKTRVKPVNRKRKAANFARAYGGAYADHIRSLPCLFSDADCGGRIEAHHTRNGGGSRKADASTLVPICTNHHDRWHSTDFRRANGEACRAMAQWIWDDYRSGYWYRTYKVIAA